MFDVYVIEVADKAAGIVARGRGGFRFHAASHAFRALDGREFRRPRDAERAARELIERRSKHG